MEKRRRESSRNEVVRLRERLEALERDFDFLHAKVCRIAKHFTLQVSELCDLSTDIVEDLKQIQHKLFPNLASDLARAHKIVPFIDTKSPDKLDRRPKTTRTKTSKKL